MSWSVFFDESESKDPWLFCVAGYIFERDTCNAMEAPWTALLEEFGVPFFHMVDCAHGAKSFKVLSRESRITLQTKIFDLVKAHMKMGLCVSFDMRNCDLLAQINFPGISKGPVDHYTLCCYWCISEVARQAHLERMHGDITYFFEAGALHQRFAAALLADVFRSRRYRYGGHHFVTKTASAGIQAADILAWQWLKDRKRELHRQPMRRDLASLLQQPHRRCHLGGHLLAATIRGMNRAGRMCDEHQRSIYWSRAKLLEGGRVAPLPPLPML